MEWGIAYLVAALALMGLGLWAGLSINAAALKAANEKVKTLELTMAQVTTQGQGALDATGEVLQNVLARKDVPADESGVDRLWGDPGPGPAPTPPGRAS